MSSSTPRRRRLAPAALGVVMAALVLAGCGSGQGQASDFKGLEDNFIKTCESTVKEDASRPEAIDVPDDFCRCAFDELSDGETAVEFDRLMEINDELREEPAALPEDVTKAFAGCSS